MEEDGKKYKLLPNGALVKEVTIKEIRPCIVAEGMVRVLMELDQPIENTIPNMMANYPPGKVNYVKNKNILTLNLYERLITIYPSGKVSMNKTVDAEDALNVIKRIMEDINLCYTSEDKANPANYEEIQDKLANIGPLDIYNCLPQTGCGECGEATCTAFAMKLLSGDASLNACTPLKDDYLEKLECLENLLGIPAMEALGWEFKGG